MNNFLEGKILQEPEIIKLLPHRHPFLMIDRVTEVHVHDDLTRVPGRKGIAFRTFTGKEPFAVGHFPNNPIFPGVYLLEALGQAGAFVLLPDLISSIKDYEKLIPAKMFFAGVDDCRFRNPVLPGDLLRLESEAEKVRRSIWQFKAQAWIVGTNGNPDKLACEASLLAMVEVHRL